MGGAGRAPHPGSRRRAPQAAFAIALLLNAPARIGNIAPIHLDRHVRRVGAGRQERIILEFLAAEVKNGRDLMYPLSVANQVRSWVYRSHMSATENQKSFERFVERH